jgi:hypothetical protein
MTAPERKSNTKGKVVGGAAVALTVSFLTVWEGYAPVAKHEHVDPPGVITWCFGRTNFDDPSVPAGTRFTKEECGKLLAGDVPKYAAPLFACVKDFDKCPRTGRRRLLALPTTWARRRFATRRRFASSTPATSKAAVTLSWPTSGRTALS